MVSFWSLSWDVDKHFSIRFSHAFLTQTSQVNFQNIFGDLGCNAQYRHSIISRRFSCPLSSRWMAAIIKETDYANCFRILQARTLPCLQLESENVAQWRGRKGESMQSPRAGFLMANKSTVFSMQHYFCNGKILMHFTHGLPNWSLEGKTFTCNTIFTRELYILFTLFYSLMMSNNCI